MSRTIFSIATVILLAFQLQADEIRWGRGTAAGMFVGNYTDAMNWDGGVVPGPADRARVDRGGTDMTLDSVIVANEFLFGVDEEPQTFTFLPTADVTINTNFFVSLNRTGVTVDIQEGAIVDVGGNFLLGQNDNCCGGTPASSAITVNIAGEVNVPNQTLLAERYGSNALNPPFFVDILLDVTGGTLTTSDIQFAPNGDLDVFFDPFNDNTMVVNVGDGGLVSLEGDKVGLIQDQIASGLYVSDSTMGSLGVRYDVGQDRTLIQVQSATGPICDITGDGICDNADLRALYDDINLGTSGGLADIDGSGTVDNADIGAWLTEAGIENGLVYLPGDSDLDGSVGGSDFTTLASNFGASGLPAAYWESGNFDGGGIGGPFDIGGGDFTSLASNFGSSSVNAIPEPGSLALMLAAVATMAGHVRKRR